MTELVGRREVLKEIDSRVGIRNREGEIRGKMHRDKELIRLRLTAGTRIRSDSLDEKAFQGKEVNTRKPKIDLFRLVP